MASNIVSDLVLCESASARRARMQDVTDDRATSALNKAKAIVFALWEGQGIATTAQMADFYEVDKESVQKVSQRHSVELNSDGLKVLRGKALRDVMDIMSTASKTSQATVWTPRAALRLGMLLRDSAVAKEVRTLLLDVVERAAPKPEAPPAPAPIPLPPADVRTANFYAALAGFGIELDNPRYAQAIKDVVIDQILGSKALPASTEVWLGVVEKAEQMGYSPILAAKYRSQLGKFVAAMGLASKKEKRLCNGTQREINLYMDCGDLETAIGDFLDAKILSTAA